MKKGKSLIILIVSIFIDLSVVGQIPQGYYSGTENLSGEELQTFLWNKIKNHTDIGYNGLWTAYQSTDARPNGKVWDIYSNCDFIFGTDQDSGSSGTSECQRYNREHTFPASWYGDGSNYSTVMSHDLFNVYPVDKKVNSERGNFPYGEVGNNVSYTSSNSCKLGNARSGLEYSGTVFEPADEYKGDLARSYFYMLTCYKDKNLNQNGSDMLSGNATFETWAVQMLLTWHENDPVSQKEIDRNNTIYNNFQHNRNPFIDCPAFAQLIWNPDYDGEPCDFIYSPNIKTKEPINIFLSENNLIKIESNNIILQINIYDITGKIVETPNCMSQQKINISDIQNGIYIVNVKMETGEMYSEKIIKLK